MHTVQKLMEMTVAELKKIATELEIKDMEKATKEVLIRAILEAAAKMPLAVNGLPVL